MKRWVCNNGCVYPQKGDCTRHHGITCQCPCHLGQIDNCPTYVPGWGKWDIRFLKMARLVGSWSKDPSTQTGAVIVRPDRSVASVGFNGFPRSMRDDPALYADREQKYSRIVHAEINALIHATGAVNGHTIYVYPLAPCDRCAVQLLQAGITRFVYPTTPEDQRGRWEPILRKASGYIAEAGAVQVEVPRHNLEDMTPAKVA